MQTEEQDFDPLEPLAPRVVNRKSETILAIEAEERRIDELREYIKELPDDPPRPRQLTDNKEARKMTPIASGFIDYFPDAIAAVAALSFIGNEQHNPGTALHWDRSKSGDEGDALMRHFVDRGTIDTDGVRHSAKVAWRAMALLQKELEDAAPED